MVVTENFEPASIFHYDINYPHRYFETFSVTERPKAEVQLAFALDA